MISEEVDTKGKDGAPANADVSRRLRAARLSLLSNFLLGALKLAVGIITGSIAILSDGVNSACDLFANGLTYFAVMRSGQPPDPDHPWGHGKYESIAGMVEAFAIFGAGLYILLEAVRELRSHVSQHAGMVGILVMVVSIIVNFMLSRRVLRIASETDSIALRAEGQHIWTDVLTSGGVLAALLASKFLEIPHIQAVAAIFVCALIFRAAYGVSLIAFAPLVDQALPADETLAIQTLLRSDSQVLGWHNLRTRRSGPVRLVDVHVMLPDEMTFVEAHRHAEALELAIRDALPGATDVIIHAEPYLEESQHQEEYHRSEERNE
ncbi:MAG TPA: cation diffusion facilitator family transporter [Armatimonadota bacterium]|nr:cation diffusion facilitator family transporter [Armatimonadota bacterium]